MASKKLNPTGAESLKRRKLVSILVPVSEADRELVKEAAAIEGRSMSSFARRTLVYRAKKVIEMRDEMTKGG